MVVFLHTNNSISEKNKKFRHQKKNLTGGTSCDSPSQTTLHRAVQWYQLCLGLVKQDLWD